MSLPDITLLQPLAEQLGVSVTELLEGRRLEAAELTPQQTEDLLHKALSLTGEPYKQDPATRNRRLLCWLATAVAAGVECLCVSLWAGRNGMTFEFAEWLMEGMSLGFGLYIWLGLKDRLPAYYDENRITGYSDGVFRINLAFTRFHNGNWPHIVRALRVWAVASPLAVPLLMAVTKPWGGELLVPLISLAGLFVPLFVAAKRYE